MAKIKLVVSDVDGTLTVRRGSFLLEVEAIKAIRMLESSGVRVAFVTGNSLPVARGLARYIGATGPVVAENGCVGLANGEVHHLAGKRPPKELVEELKRLGLRESWQNPCRYHDLAFLSDGSVSYRDVERVVSKYEGFKVFYSGYAFHIAPAECGKGAAVRWISEVTGVDLSEILSIGDGENDVEMLRLTGWSAAPADADEAARRAARIVASKPGGQGFAEVASLILSEKL
ncbi:phosphoglycolate phosphatase [Stetteria hydrogenophila]